MPFTRQYFYLRELQKSGNLPQYGSFKFSASDLHTKGVLIAIDDFTVKQFGQIFFTFSSSHSGSFTVEAFVKGAKLPAPAEIKLEDLLQKQLEGIQSMMLFGVAEVNIDMLIYLLNKKFYL
ncbi:hypothetical protein HDU82_006323 [Entophlyctis luteolus]|nr:hypothetical protein HDU82_006323 [Entophlyctis luteolus]